MTRFFSFFEGAGSSTGRGLTTSGGAGRGGAGSTTGGAATTGRTAGHEQPADQTTVMSKHIGKIIFLFIEIITVIKSYYIFIKVYS
jgi:hypothetical protein